MSKKPRKRKRRKNTLGGGRSRRDEYYSTGELFLAGLGVLLLVLAAGIIITSLF